MNHAKTSEPIMRAMTRIALALLLMTTSATAGVVVFGCEKTIVSMEIKEADPGDEPGLESITLTLENAPKKFTVRLIPQDANPPMSWAIELNGELCGSLQ
jgi:hypothetical protein